MPDRFLHAFAAPAKAEDDYVRIVRGEGCLLWDDHGREYLDAMASLWYCQVGHGRAEIIDAVADQMRRLEAYNVFDPFTNEPAATAAALIAERSPHPSGRVFLACSGSEAVDTALKLVRLVHQRRDAPHRKTFVRFTNGYHGTNFGGTSAQGIAANREGWGDLVPHFVEITHGESEEAALCFAEHGDEIAAVLVEPIQGAGGVHPAPPGFLAALRRLCDAHGALLVFDEVISGFGRTGEWFAAQHYGVEPDLMTFAKGVTSGYQPLSGVILSRSVAETLEEPGFVLRTGYTYSGHPAVCAAAVANIGLIEADALLSRASHIGAVLSEGLDALAHDGLVESVRGIGAVWAVDLGRDAVSARDAMRERGVIVRAIGTARAMCPPLIISDAELGRLLDTLSTALASS